MQSYCIILETQIKNNFFLSALGVLNKMHKDKPQQPQRDET